MREIELYAGTLAPVVGRLRTAIDRGLRSERNRLLHEWDLGDASFSLLGLLADTRNIRIAAWADIAAASVFEAPSTVMKSVDELVDRGMIDAASEGVRARPAGLEVIGQVDDLLRKTTENLWGDHPTLCTRLVPLLRSVGAAGSTSDGPTLRLCWPPFEPEGITAPLHVAHLLATLQRHRFDAELMTWRETGITPQEARCITGGALQRVLDEEINRRDSVPYSSLTAEQRIELLAGLGTLPG